MRRAYTLLWLAGLSAVLGAQHCVAQTAGGSTTLTPEMRMAELANKQKAFIEKFAQQAHDRDTAGVLAEMNTGMGRKCWTLW